MRQTDQAPHDTAWQMAGIGVAVLLAVAIAAVVIAQANMTRAVVGDIVSFRRGSDVPQALQVQITAQRMARDGTPAGTCVLQPEIIAETGGSLVVEVVRSVNPGSYEVHWAGPHTSAAPTDCGSTADLLLNDAQLGHLAATAGGFGVNQQQQVASRVVAASLPVVAN